MAYQYSETRKHILTPELVIHDMESGKGGDKIMGVLMLLLPPLGALVATFFMYLITGGEGVEFVVGIIICGLFWLGALMLMAAAVFILVNQSKPLRPEDIHIVKRTLDTISYSERQPSSGRGSVERDVFYFAGMDKYFPSPTEVALAEEGDEYYIVTYTEGGTYPVRIYRADAYIWNG
jgi:hypothetical protein